MRIVSTILGCAGVGLMITGCGTGSVEVTPPKPDAATIQLCKRLQLPDKVDGQSRRSVTPGSALTAAWGSPPIGYRCGVPLPPHDLLAPSVAVDGVLWLPTPEDRPVTYTAIGRKAYVEVTIPPSYADKGKVAGEILMMFNPAIEKAIPKKEHGEI